MGQQGIQIESLVAYWWPEIIWQKQEPNRLPGTDCAYIQLGHCYSIWNKEVWSAYQGKEEKWLEQMALDCQTGKAWKTLMRLIIHT